MPYVPRPRRVTAVSGPVCVGADETGCRNCERCVDRIRLDRGPYWMSTILLVWT